MTIPGVNVPRDVGFDDFVRVSKEIMRGRATKEQHRLVRKVLLSLMPGFVPPMFK